MFHPESRPLLAEVRTLQARVDDVLPPPATATSLSFLKVVAIVFENMQPCRFVFVYTLESKWSRIPCFRLHCPSLRPQVLRCAVRATCASCAAPARFDLRPARNAGPVPTRLPTKEDQCSGLP